MVFVNFVTSEVKPENIVYKVSFGGLLLLAVLFLVFKRVFFKDKIKKWKERTNNKLSDLDVESDPERAANIIEELRMNRTIETVFNFISPAIFFIAAIVACEALEKALMKLSGALGLMFVCYALGTVFSVLKARTLRAKHLDADKVKEVWYERGVLKLKKKFKGKNGKGDRE
jgi:predicted DNA-binding antitoxin AbrB/MazE fold protein